MSIRHVHTVLVKPSGNIQIHNPDGPGHPASVMHITFDEQSSAKHDAISYLDFTRYRTTRSFR